MTFWILVGIVIGIFIPAPYETIAKTALTKAWNWIKSWASDDMV